MKKLIASLIMMSFFAFALPYSVSAQNRCYKPKRAKYSRDYARRNYQTRGYNYDRRPSFYRRHRNLINVGAGAGGGALIGGLLGGNRRGMAAGALIGAGAGALYTYVLKPKRRR